MAGFVCRDCGKGNAVRCRKCKETFCGNCISGHYLTHKAPSQRPKQVERTPKAQKPATRKNKGGVRTHDNDRM